MRPLPADVEALFPWESRFLEVSGGRMAYLDEGPRDAPVILCLHGNPTWSFYWRAVVQHFSDRWRVVVPDHIGCGRSDKPQSWTYRLGDHISNVQQLMDHLMLDQIRLLVHDWGGAIGMGAAVEQPGRFERFLVSNTAAFRSQEIPPSIASCRIPGFGALAVRGGNAFARVATWRATSKGLSAPVKRGLVWPYDSWANRIATHRFVQDIPLKASHPSYPTLHRIEEGLSKLSAHPMLLLWGEQDFCFTPRFRARWQELFPQAEVQPVAEAGHYILEDATELYLDQASQFLGSP